VSDTFHLVATRRRHAHTTQSSLKPSHVSSDLTKKDDSGGQRSTTSVHGRLRQRRNPLKCSRNYYAPVRSEGGNKRCLCPSVRLSVCPSVAYTAYNSRTQRPSVPKFGRKVLRLRCNSYTSFKVKRSKVTVTRPINVDTHCAPYLPNAKAYEVTAYR